MADARNYRYEASGKAAKDQTWTITSEIHNIPAGEFPRVFDLAMRDCFHRLTNGQAVYGKPGVGCSGPYRVVRLVLEEIG